MSDLTEHLKFNNGNIGYLKILTDKFAHQDYWSRVDEIIGDYTKVHPMEMEIIVRQNALKAAGQHHKWGEAKGSSGELRLGMSMPIMLLRTLEVFDPEIFLDRKKSHLFRQRYKGLCTYAQ